VHFVGSYYVATSVGFDRSFCLQIRRRASTTYLKTQHDFTKRHRAV